MRLTARGKQGSPLSLHLQVPESIKDNYKHRIYWSKRSEKSAFGYNEIVTVFDKPCVRRWFEFKGIVPPYPVRYLTPYTPPTVIPKPERYWLVMEGSDEFASFTNVVEAWLLLLSVKEFENRNWQLVYVDRTAGI